MKKRRVVAASDFKAHCLAVMDEVEATGEEVTITKHGRPVARLVPASSARTMTDKQIREPWTYFGTPSGEIAGVTIPADAERYREGYRVTLIDMNAPEMAT